MHLPQVALSTLHPAVRWSSVLHLKQDVWRRLLNTKAPVTHEEATSDQNLSLGVPASGHRNVIRSSIAGADFPLLRIYPPNSRSPPSSLQGIFIVGDHTTTYPYSLGTPVRTILEVTVRGSQQSPEHHHHTIFAPQTSLGHGRSRGHPCLRRSH